MVNRNQAERRMAAQAIVPGALGAGLAFLVGTLLNGADAGVSALLGVAVVSGTFAVWVLMLGVARSASPAAVQVVAMFGWLLRLGIIVALMFGLKGAVSWFDPAAFGLAAVTGALAVAIYETKIWLADERSRAATGSSDRKRPEAGDAVGSGS